MVIKNHINEKHICFTNIFVLIYSRVWGFNIGKYYTIYII